MKAMLAGFAGMVVISVGAYVVLGQIGFTAQDANAGANVRLD